tara:strand:+ start:775 stop:1419 length:645 start_codon:yes stop_codon:yes gene_type:complete
MKTLITFISILLTSLILLTSCGTISITKRKHSNGYHVFHNNIKQSSNISKSDNKFLNPTENNEITELPQKKSEPLTLSGEEISSQTNETNNKSTQDKEPNESDRAVKNKSKQKAPIPRDENKTDLAKDSYENNSNLKPLSLKKATSKIKESVTNSNLTKASAQSESALSLFWIVILVILILWLLGYLGGVIGNLIHLLLVVALILLILWLLRII